METKDPREALKSADIAQRAAGARDLAHVGTWEDVEDLVRLAMGDKSPAVRLYTAAAAGDILARHRGAAGQKALTAVQKEAVHAWVRGVDPERNNGILMLLSAVADKAAIDRLGRNLTKSADSAVRIGAATALRRMAVSGGPFDEAHLIESAKKWLTGKVHPEVPIEVGKLVGECGWPGFDDLLRTLAGGTKAAIGTADVARKQLDARATPAGWEGIYESDGRDVFEVRDTAPPTWVAIVDGTWWSIEATPKGKKKPATEPKRASVPIAFAGYGGAVGKEPVRMVFAPKVGEPDLRAPAVQHGGVTYWKQEGKALAEWVEAHIDEVDGCEPLMIGLARWLDGQESAAAQRARAVLTWKGGDAACARRILEDQIATKKPRVDVYLVLAKVCLELGDKKSAKKALDEFLEKAAKKAPERTEAEALRKTLK